MTLPKDHPDYDKWTKGQKITVHDLSFADKSDWVMNQQEYENLQKYEGMEATIISNDTGFHYTIRFEDGYELDACCGTLFKAINTNTFKVELIGRHSLTYSEIQDLLPDNVSFNPETIVIDNPPPHIEKGIIFEVPQEFYNDVLVWSTDHTQDVHYGYQIEITK